MKQFFAKQEPNLDRHHRSAHAKKYQVSESRPFLLCAWGCMRRRPDSAARDTFCLGQVFPTPYPRETDWDTHIIVYTCATWKAALFQVSRCSGLGCCLPSTMKTHRPGVTFRNSKKADRSCMGRTSEDLPQASPRLVWPPDIRSGLRYVERYDEPQLAPSSFHPP